MARLDMGQMENLGRIEKGGEQARNNLCLWQGFGSEVSAGTYGGSKPHRAAPLGKATGCRVKTWENKGKK